MLSGGFFVAHRYGYKRALLTTYVYKAIAKLLEYGSTPCLRLKEFIKALIARYRTEVGNIYG
jgi:hypothetical protein